MASSVQVNMLQMSPDFNLGTEIFLTVTCEVMFKHLYFNNTFSSQQPCQAVVTVSKPTF
jgi:hypothetical protein